MNDLSYLDELISHWAGGDDGALAGILELSYVPKLLPLARKRLKKESKTNHLPEDLVHRVYELMAKMDKRPADTTAFTRAFNQNMNWVLLDDHKSRTRLRRGGPNLDQVSISLCDEEDT